MSSSTVVSIHQLRKEYAKKAVLNDLDWQVEAGDVVALLGKNGAGKTTLLESIMNLRDTDGGELRLWGLTWKDLPESRRKKIAFVSQRSNGFEAMKVRDFFAHLGPFFDAFDAAYCQSLQDRWLLEPNQRIGVLSAGQTQIMHGILALSARPDLLVLDEPVAHLDPDIRRKFIGEIIEIGLEKKTTVIFSSHIISDLERVATKVAILQQGVIKRCYDMEALKADIAYVKMYANKRLEKSPEFNEFVNWEQQENGATAMIVSPLVTKLDALRKRTDVQIETTPMSLEDWYMEVANAQD